LRIRAAVPSDQDFVTSAAARLGAFGPPAWRTAEEIGGAESRVLREFFVSPPRGAALRIAEGDDGASAGFTYLEELVDYFTGRPHGHVGMIVVAESAEGRGVGGALMRDAEAWARQRGYDRLTLSVFERNAAARAVYEHLGYEVETLRMVKLL
jgi:ribosomal protein S18 acetylase RimI-like enzyme